MAPPFPLSLLPWESFPSMQQSAVIMVLEALVVFGAAYAAGWLRLERGVKVGYTRKIFHMAIFSTAGLMMWVFGYGPVLYLGGIAFLFLIYTCERGDGFILYEGLAREEDAPDRTYYLIVPFLATAAGGVVSIYFFGPFATVGFFVAGWGDAAGEPVGTRFGRHWATLPYFGKKNFRRSLEGSLGVLVVSFLACAFALTLSMDWSVYRTVLVSVPVAITAMSVEFFSPHGIDNFSVQVFSTMSCYWAATVVSG